ncbi:hypothetical protein RR48_13626 [Papilio machaon]|uniref:Uncharacterized protein n=1 Tax=Papilio machaon TaxID=76193 RepID=A0A194RBA7_PAPMA|nr:hypothetical protein RR48_13626 [Papilio machaon]
MVFSCDGSQDGLQLAPGQPFLGTLGDCSSLLCGRTKEVEVGGNAGAGAALALSLSRPPSAGNTTCQLRLTAPEAAAFTVRLIDVKTTCVMFLSSVNKP